ncbi:MAG TPA: hypothetical protein PLK36_10710, partial [Methanoregulaceae archaeon]|nr:hypothetical protein [Methanoregulaceae archaeon]HQN90535.1 hypothetical protein [Methanoregulaceae archaeon]
GKKKNSIEHSVPCPTRSMPFISLIKTVILRIRCYYDIISLKKALLKSLHVFRYMMLIEEFYALRVQY